MVVCFLASRTRGDDIPTYQIDINDLIAKSQNPDKMLSFVLSAAQVSRVVLGGHCLFERGSASRHALANTRGARSGPQDRPSMARASRHSWALGSIQHVIHPDRDGPHGLGRTEAVVAPAGPRDLAAAGPFPQRRAARRGRVGKAGRSRHYLVA
jgi:hypothetical protein